MKVLNYSNLFSGSEPKNEYKDKIFEACEKDE